MLIVCENKYILISSIQAIKDQGSVFTMNSKTVSLVKFSNSFLSSKVHDDPACL